MLTRSKIVELEFLGPVFLGCVLSLYYNPNNVHLVLGSVMGIGVHVGGEWRSWLQVIHAMIGEA